MDDEQAERLERKLDEIIEELPTIRALGLLFVQRQLATNSLGLNKNTISQNEQIAKYGAVGSNVTVLQIKDLLVLRKRKAPKKGRKSPQT